MISITTSRKIVVQTQDESIKTKPLKFFFGFLLGPFVSLQNRREKDDFDRGLCFFSTVEIIKIDLARKASCQSIETTDFNYKIIISIHIQMSFFRHSNFEDASQRISYSSSTWVPSSLFIFSFIYLFIYLSAYWFNHIWHIKD